MAHFLSRRRTIIVFTLCSLLVIVACQPGTRVGGQATEGPGSVDLVFGPGPFNLPAATVGLSDLSSYHETLTLTFEGTQDGQPEQWSSTYVMLANQNPPSSQVTIDTEGDPAAQVFVAEADGALFERRGEDACTASVVQQGASLAEVWEPAGFLPSVIGAEQAGSETVNGVAANHYTFDERAMGALDIAQSTGEIWVASDGEYVIRYVLIIKGTAQYFGDGKEGTVTWDYELTDVNQPLTIELPDDCPAGMVDAPLLPNAADVVNMPGLLAYSTVTSLADAAAFYQEQIPNLGWELLGEPTITETTVMMEFTQGNQTMTVIITPSDAGTKVHILLNRSQE